MSPELEALWSAKTLGSANIYQFGEEVDALICQNLLATWDLDIHIESLVTMISTDPDSVAVYFCVAS